MCYYNGVKVTKSEFIRLKSIERAIAQYDFLDKPMHIGFLYGPTPVLKSVEGENDFELTEMEWGFLPDSKKWPYITTRAEADKIRKGYFDERGKWKQYTFLNAVSEELLFKDKIYREAALERRCLVLSTGFYEWQHIYPKNKRTGEPLKTAKKYPYNISVNDSEYFLMAGIWQPWTDAETGEYTETVAIVTTDANFLMKQIHNSKERMPTILNEDLAWEWMFGDLSEERISEIAKYQFPANMMNAHTVPKNFLELPDPSIRFDYPESEVPPLIMAA